jgi:hypothetical protein
MASVKYEYRVCWQRGTDPEFPSESRPPRTQILQSKRGAIAKVERLKRIDGELSGEIDWQLDPYGPDKHPLEGMPPLIGEPVIQQRTVGEWEALDA